MISWNIYEVTSEKHKLHGIKFRGHVRLLGLNNNFDVLVENATDKDNCVRFATTDESHQKELEKMIKGIVSDADITLVMKDVNNPVLSKMKVNYHERYQDEL